MIEYNIAPESWRDERASVRFDESRSALAVVARAETHASVLAFLKERTEQAARLGVVEIWEVEGPLESVDALITSTPRERATLLERRVAEDPLEQRVYAFVVGVVGTPVRLDGYRARSFLGAVEVASGGTGFAVLECPDPIIESSGDGVRIQAQVDSTPLEALVRLDLAFGRYSSTLERSARFVTGGAIGPGRLPPSVLPEGNAVAKLGAADDRGARQVWIPWQVELPSQHKSGVTLKQVVEPGLPHVLRVASAPGGRARVILSRTRYSPAGKEESDR